MLPLIPLISLASSLVPEIIGLFGGKRAGDVAGQVATVVQQVAGTDNVEDATKAIQADSAKASELKVKLEEIKQRFVELQLQDAKDERAAMIETLKAEIADRAGARGAMTTALGVDTWAAKAVAMGPPVVSAIVLIGFFVFTAWLVRSPPDNTDSTMTTLLNVVIGALVAGFTAVLNFWLGSSQGSRDKDKTVAALQQAQSEQATETVRQVREATNQAIVNTASATAASATAATAATTAAAGAAPRAAATALARPSGGTPGMAGRFDLCLPIVLDVEGGFSNNPADPGGATMMGITQQTLAGWRGAAVTEDDVRNLTKEEATQIYRAQYWNAMRCDDQPKGLDLLLFGFGVNAGPGTAVKMLQRTIGTTPDGAVGPFTLKATHGSDPVALIEALGNSQLDYYKNLAGFATFGDGWTKRLENIRRQALLMASA